MSKKVSVLRVRKTLNEHRVVNEGKAEDIYNHIGMSFPVTEEADGSVHIHKPNNKVIKVPKGALVQYK